jgi:hypothetical protein
MLSFQDRLLPAPVGGGFNLPDQWIWGASVIRDDEGLYHMFASMWSKRVPMCPNWKTNSRIVRAISETPTGPYRYVEDVLPPRGATFWDGRMTHNPTIHRSGDTFLLFYIGTTFDQSIPEGPASDELRQASGANQRIGLATAPHPAGPWTRRDKPILEPRPGKWDGWTITNPAACVLEGGRVLLLYKSRRQQGTPMQYGVTMAERYAGPYFRVRDEPILGSATDIEDAYVWREDGKFHMIHKDCSGQIAGEFHAGVYAQSADGIDWHWPENPKAYSRTVRWDDGTTTTQGSFERPQLLIEDGRPTHLFVATGDGPGAFWNATHTWNMVVPLKVNR